jgi:prepilin-type N-terminal cleavage/methylation domain-containing protein
MNTSLHTNGESKSARAFTLVEMLMVIAIIGLLAGLLVGLAPGAARKKRDALVEAQKQALITMIESYKEKYGSYPPCNGYMPIAGPQDTANGKYYDNYARTNPLFYELCGAVVTNVGTMPAFAVLNVSNIVKTAFYTNVLGVGGVVNSLEPQNFHIAPLRPRTANKTVEPFKPIIADPSRRTDLNGGVLVFVVPVSLDWTPSAPSVPMPSDFVNGWRYDCTSTNRHNIETFDLWAVYSNGKQIITNGNWMK